ncbi:MAG: MBOAT family protein [Lachnospiraceae bacterium]|nr:MBOAT family protein [Lachnospiraceae bacterium]
MVFNSFSFLLFFPIVLAVYFVVPKRARYLWLLLSSYYFYMSWNAKYAILIGISTVITYLSGLFLERATQMTDEKRGLRFKKWIVAGSFVTNLGILFFFKYFDFALSVCNNILTRIGLQIIDKPFDVLLPVGISFYTFQALSYTMDVYRGQIRAEKNIFRYALFVSFFPQLVAGPIERSTSLMKQMQKVHEIKLWNYERITSGLSMMLWGYFMKMVIADRLAILVDQVFDGYEHCGATALILAAVFFAFQIYCDFGSYSLIAIGSAKVMGFTLMENFATPYFSRSIKEFWRRWHISLSTWFRDYLYIPLGGSRKGKVRTYVNLMLTFLASGLWHGASFSFVAWGGLHGLYQIIGDLTRPVKDKLIKSWHIRTECFSYRLLQRMITFVLVDIAWIFFRAGSLRRSVFYLVRILQNPDPWVLFDGSLFSLGLSNVEFLVAVCSLLILLAVDLLRYRRSMRLDAYLSTQSLWYRWFIYLFLLCAILIFGIYGTAYDATEFIYFQF